MSSHSDIAKAWQAVLGPTRQGISLCLNEFEKVSVGTNMARDTIVFTEIESLLKCDAACQHSQVFRHPWQAHQLMTCASLKRYKMLTYDFTPLAIRLSLPAGARFDRGRVR